MLELVIVVLIVLWLLGYFGPARVPAIPRTGNLIHPIPTLLSYFSRFMTLRAGDVICTGTPAGAGLFWKTFLAPGDRVEVEIEGIGVLSNPVVAA